MSRKVGGQELTSVEYSLLQDLQLQAKVDPLTTKAISQLTDPSRDWKEYLTSEERLVRFLFARELSVQKAHTMWQNWVNWFIQSRPDLVTAAEVSSEIATKKARWIGTDKKGNPCLVVQIKYHIPLTETIPLTTKFFQYVMEIGLQKAKASGTSKITVIWDSRGFRRTQLNGAFIEFLKIATRLLMDYYPNTLAAVYITDPDFIVRLGYGILKPFLSQIITNKIHQIPLKDLVQYIDPAELLQDYGGSLQEQSFSAQEQQVVNDPKMGQHQQQLDGSHLFDSQLRIQTDEFLSLANDSTLFFDQHSEIYHAYLQQQNQPNDGIINHNYNTNNGHIKNEEDTRVYIQNNNDKYKNCPVFPIPEQSIDTSSGMHPTCCVSCSIF